MKNDGFIAPPTLKEEPDQWLAGGLKGIKYEEVVKPPTYWNVPKYIPTGEIQRSMVADTQACVIFSGVRVVSFQINKMIADGILDLVKLKPWLDSNNKFNGCERGLSILSGTSRTGNTQMNVGNTIDDYGIAPEWVYPNPAPNIKTTWKEYHTISKAKLKEVKNWGKKWGEYFHTRFERIPNSKSSLEYHLRQVPIWWATACCPGWGYKDIIPACYRPPCHATTGYGERPNEYRNDLDHYTPFEKKLAWNYPIYYPYKLVVYPNESIKKKIMLQRKKNTKEVFLNIGGERYWIKDAEDFNQLKKAQPIDKIEWENIEEVDIFTTPYNGKIIGSTNLVDILKKFFGKIN